MVARHSTPHFEALRVLCLIGYLIVFANIVNWVLIGQLTN